MTFLSPWAVWALAGLPVVIALYFLRLRRRAVKVSTHMFWERAANKTSRHAFFQRLRHLLSLLLHIAIFLLLAGALAKPVMDRLVNDGASVVIILDCRARMQAKDESGATRFERAIHTARAYAAETGERRQFAIIEVDSAPSVAVPFTSDERRLLDLLGEIKVTDAAGEMGAALDLAYTLLEARGGDRRVILLSDGVPVAESKFPLTSHAFPALGNNVGITRFATRTLPANPETSEVLLEVRNFGDAAVKTSVEISFDGRPIDVKALTLPAGGRSFSVFPALVKSGRASRGWLTARIEADDSLAVDNSAFATLPGARSRRVLLVSKGNFFMERILEADSSVKFEMLAPEAYSSELGAKFSAVIFDQFVPDKFELAKAEGNFLFVKSTPFSAGAVIEQPLVTEVDSSHPSTRNVSLQNVSILRSTALAVPLAADGWRFSAPLRSFDNALLVTGQRNAQRLAALLFDVAESDLPLRVAFPLLISNTVHWLAGDEPETLPGVIAGRPVNLPDGAKVSAEPMTAWPRDGSVHPAVAGGAFRPMRNGFYHVEEGGVSRWIAVNTFSEPESESKATSASTAVAPLPSAVFTGWPLWQWLAIAGFVLLLGEWWLHHRRRTE
ncbi:MAG: hypothetical protein RL088_2737 [Verrucomicrobiota bacterium]|jgi:hypothetical protein